jgi:hypothetical protein
LLIAIAIVGAILFFSQIPSDQYQPNPDNWGDATVQFWGMALMLAPIIIPPACTNDGNCTNEAQALSDKLDDAASAAGDSAESAGDLVKFETGQLQHEYSHASDFGVYGNWNKQTGEALKQAILNLINGKNTLSFQGTFRGTIQGTHYFDPTTRLWAFIDENGQYVASWKLSPEQLEYLQQKYNVQ